MEKNMDNLNIEDLQKYIHELELQIKSSKKYGLVWDKEDTSEDVVLMCKDNIPVVCEDNEKTLYFGEDNNVLIEGDNFHVLTALNYVLQSSIDVIYIDPPYNTGKDTGDGGFQYNDKFVNLDDGFKHSKWINFIYKRLKLARNLLKDDGIIFISIGDDECFNLKLLCDEIFGPNNFIENYIWESTFRPDNSSPILRRNAEYILCYAKNKPNIKKFNGDPSKTEGMPSLTKGKEKIKTICFPRNTVKTLLADGIYHAEIKDNGKNLKWELLNDVEEKTGLL